MRKLLIVLIVCFKSFAGDGTLPPANQPFYPAFFDSDSVLMVPHHHYSSKVIDQLIEEITASGFRVYLTDDGRFPVSDLIIPIPVSSTGSVRERVMPNFMMDLNSGKWRIIAGSQGAVARDVDQWFSKAFDLPLESDLKLKTKNKLIVDNDSNCFVVAGGPSSKVLVSKFGCQKILYFSCRSWDCAISDSLVILKNKKAVTIDGAKAILLKQMGYKTYLIPSYSSSPLSDVLILGDHLFFLYHDIPRRHVNRVRKIYKSAGYEVHAIESQKALCSGVHMIADSLPLL